MVMVVMNDWFIPMVNETPQVLLVGAKQDRRHPIIHEHIRLILRFVAMKTCLFTSIFMTYPK